MNMIYAYTGTEVTSSVQEDFGQKDYEREMERREAVKTKAKADYDKEIADGQVLPPYIEPTFPVYVTKLEKWKLGKETITQTAVEHNGVIVRDNSILKHVDGVIEYDADKVADNAKKAQIQALKQTRDDALNTNTVDMLGYTFDSRPKDLSNIQLGIDKSETLWPDVNDYMVDVTVADLTKLLTDGINQGEAIWDSYKQAVKKLQ